MIGEYVLAGYRVASRADGMDRLEATLPATGVVSISDCVVDVLAAGPWDEWFGDVASAQRALEQAPRGGAQVLGVGVAVGDVAGLLADVADGGWGQVAGSLPERLGRREPVASGEVLGFELVGYDSGRWHTWICLGGLVRDVAEATGVWPGRWGLIQDEGAARVAAEWLTASNLGDPKVFLWVAAMLVRC